VKPLPANAASSLLVCFTGVPVNSPGRFKPWPQPAVGANSGKNNPKAREYRTHFMA
jgi:hypothetical protein